MLPDLDTLIRITLEAMAKEERPDEEEAARIYERIFSDKGKEEDE